LQNLKGLRNVAKIKELQSKKKNKSGILEPGVLVQNHRR
jgi:hypothetical protein